MKLNRLAFVGGTAAVALAGFVLIAAPGNRSEAAAAPAVAPTAAAGTYELDAVHCSNMFRIRHMGVANFRGRFNEMSGGYTFDPASPESARFNITINAASIDTNNKGRDNHLRSPDFFNVAEYPEITFKSTGVEPLTDDTMKVTGDLTLLGTTRPVTVDMKLVGMGETRQGFKSGFDGTFTVKRSEFGMETYVAEGGLGDEVTIMVSLEGNRK